MKVLLPLDGSEPAQTTLKWALEILSAQSTELFILTVIPKANPEIFNEAYEVENALAVLSHAKEAAAQSGFTVAKAEYMIADPAEAICQYATDESVDQILMGSHGRTALGEVLFGSVSKAVFEHAKQPVFVYRNKDLAQAVK